MKKHKEKAGMAYKINLGSEWVFLSGACIFFFGGIIAGVVVFAYQLYIFLQKAEWISYSVLDVAKSEFISGFAVGVWAKTPESWLGVHKILDFLPLSFSLVVFGVVASLVFRGLYRDQLSANKEMYGL